MPVACRHQLTAGSRLRSSDSLRWLFVVAFTLCLAGSNDAAADVPPTSGASGDQALSRLVHTQADENDVSDQEAADAQSDDILGSSSDWELPSVMGGRFVIPEISAASTATETVGNGSTPDGFRTQTPRPLAPLPEIANERRMIGQDSGTDGSWDWSVTQWTAADTYSNPRYFEDVMLERHGHQRWGHLQPLASGVRFFTTIPMLTYKMAIKPPCDCEYTMGYYRTGSCAPTLYQRPPWDRKAIIAESAAVATGIIAVP